MTRGGWYAGALAVLLLPAVFQLGPSPGGMIGPDVARADDASPPEADLAPIAPRAGLFSPPSAGAAMPFVWPALTPLAAPSPGIDLPPEAVSDFARFLQICPFAGLAAWLVRLRHTRWSRIPADHDEPADPPGDNEPEFASITCPGAAAPIAPTQAEGADLAARARFVAMSFAFPEGGAPYPDASRRQASDWPLHLHCRPTRFTLTLQHAALVYRLEFCNRGTDPLGPLMIHADLAAAEGWTDQGNRAGFAADALPLCHYLDKLPAGERIELTGELRLPLAGVIPLRLGAAELLVPLMRLYAESAGESRPALNVTSAFAIGLPPLSPGGGIQPFRLDSGPGIWRKLTARRLVSGDPA